ncbi:DEAD/DEAH box helicase:Helicase, C-terminal:ATP/GTP-binding site motif A (P-loop):Aldehyde dehydrogenase [Fulvimarina pelagi HTCC2506]|uniref:DEAD/DEAH box helicase:Helicase, C-terminal:ATP/GTP-binding site motif A (P-loop):Aldehyde dehydrogenase n=2 Tax=Fulvimarina pelagi TaxID=217511 RepID=Q0G1N7_9HYPH|nr:helicase-related protein [Fulvimarina pelagi]EAU41044.1 DEAD/DEAH box helicase:Helicase, C-terminal:ATP/GTP-binding site motif A (P-loop):Aldehyde dehydrogenase [Fulvimarina pelagi HTCC2506]BAT30940.1 DEAD/DEAH box helicase [Fulvimarina pelagi]
MSDSVLFARSSSKADTRQVTAVLGPTNTGKTFLAIERMVAHSSGTIGLPLRLLAREVYQKVCDRVGAANVALITGEEKIKPPHARYSVCTVEAMPRNPGTAFVAIDEVQLASDLERGHVFTDRILNCRGYEETLLLGASTMAGVLNRLLPGMQTATRPRLSNLMYAGQKKITRLPRRSAIVAFSAAEVYAIAELIRRQRGGAAVVLGALSPRTRNAQVELYQTGEVDFLVATDAIGMGLNLDVDHVAFAQDWKYDGFQYRQLTPAEFGQIAGRAGRHLRDGTFGVTAHVDPLSDDLVDALQSHSFQSVPVLQWRSANMDFSTVEALKNSLDTAPPDSNLAKALPAVDRRALEYLSRDEDVMDLAGSPKKVELLWEACKLPDYRRIAPAQHAEIIATVYRDLAKQGRVAEDYMASQVARADRTDGEIDTLSQRIAEIRTWTYISHRPGWLADPTHWREKTRSIEDRLSDALHDRLTKRFVDRRTSVLMRRLRENAFMEAEIANDGTVMVEGHAVGELQGFRFSIDATAEGQDGKAVRAASQKALAGEFDKRAERFANAPNGDFAIGSDAIVRWLGAPVAALSASDDPLKPKFVLLADDQLTGPARDKVAARIERFLGYQVTTILKPLIDLRDGEGLDGAAKGIAYRLYENFGLVQRREISEDVRGLDQAARAALRRLGVRFGAYHIFVPVLVKPAPANLITLLWAIHNDARERAGYGDVPELLATGRTSAVADTTYDPKFYELAGYRLLGRRAVRVDILERLADIIRPALSWKPGEGRRPDGGYSGNQFLITPGMMSILGATADDMEEILKGLGYRADQKNADAIEAELDRFDADAEAKIAAAKEAEAAKAAETSAAAVGPEGDGAAHASVGETVPASEVASHEQGVDPASSSLETPETPAEGAAYAVASTKGEVDRGSAADMLGHEARPIAQADRPASEAIEVEIGEDAGKGDALAAQQSSQTQPPDRETVILASAEAAAAKTTAEQLEVGDDATSPESGSPSDLVAAGSEEPEEPRTVLVWRQHRSDRTRRPGGQRQRTGGQRFEGQQARGRGQGGEREDGRQDRGGPSKPGGKGGKRRFDKPKSGERGGHGGSERREDKRNQRADPDSPFAKLAALKDKLGK